MEISSSASTVMNPSFLVIVSFQCSGIFNCFSLPSFSFGIIFSSYNPFDLSVTIFSSGVFTHAVKFNNIAVSNIKAANCFFFLIRFLPHYFLLQLPCFCYSKGNTFVCHSYVILIKNTRNISFQHTPCVLLFDSLFSLS